MSSNIIYSIGMPLNRGGMGTIAWHACHGLMKKNLLQQVFAPEIEAAQQLKDYCTGLPSPFNKAFAVLNRLGWHYWKDNFFDSWVSLHLPKGTNYYGWMNQSLASIRRCHREGGKSWIDRGSVEARLQERWLKEEYNKYGLCCPPIGATTLKRMIQEANETDFIVAPSKLVADSFIAAGYPKSKIQINPLGIDLPYLDPSQSMEESGKIRFVFIGQLSVQKGMPDLLSTWKKIKTEKAELILAGIIPFTERNIIKPFLNDNRNVIWNGHCGDVPKLLKNCDVLILPSAQDGFGLVILEAFAAGVPVIVSDRVGAQDCVVDGKNGFIFPFGDRQALATRIEWFIQDSNRARIMSKAAQETATRYSWESYGNRLADLLK